jgi:predicted enzyme related to lactoylglutathione lyase
MTGVHRSRAAVAVVALVAMSAALLVSVAASPRSAPASATPSAQPGEFVWRDLVTSDPAGSRAFYGALLGWTFENSAGVDPGYQVIKQNGVPIGGMVPMRATSAPVVAQWLTYVVVADVDRAVMAFRRAGGHVFRGPLTTRKNLRVAVVADPQGAPLGLASRGPLRDTAAPAPPPLPTPPALHQWLWTEYVATDAPAALSLFAEVLGFKNEISETRDTFTYYLLTTDRPRAGLFRSPWQRETSAWLPYVRVADPAAMAVRAAELGGRVALAPAPGVRHGSLAIVLDPAGAPVALQKYPFETGETR